MTLTRLEIDPRIWTDCKLFYFLYDFCMQYSSSILVLMSLEKCFAVYFPMKSKMICTVRTAKWATGIVGTVLISFNIYHFFATGSHFIKSYGRYICDYNLDLNAVKSLNAVDSALYSFGPFLIMFTTNFAIVFKLVRAKCQSNSTESTNQALAKAATRGTAMVVTVSVTFLVLTALNAVEKALLQVIHLGDYPIYFLVRIVTQYLNHCINCVLYCIVGTRFRNEFLKIICRKERPEGFSSSHSVNNTRLSTISGSRIQSM